MKPTKKILLALFFILQISCGPAGEESPRQELIDSLRMLGVQGEKVVYEIPASPLATTTATVSIFAVSTKDLDVNMEPWSPDGRTGIALLSPLENISIVSAVMTREKKGSLYAHTGILKVKIPSAALWKKFPAGGGKLAFGIKLFSTQETEYAVGNILAYPTGAPELAWQPPNLELTIPTTFNASVGQRVDLALKSDPAQNEALLFGWFVSSGQIASRREKVTSWEPATAGTQTVIATVRGRESLAFKWEFFTFEVK